LDRHLQIDADPDPIHHCDADDVTDPDLDPTFQFDADPCGSGATTVTTLLSAEPLSALKKLSGSKNV
jgi:hypothetical protein